MVKKMTFHFNHDLYRKIRDERKRLGLSVMPLSIEETEHPLIGKRMFSHETGKDYKISAVHSQWYEGWYLLLTLLDNKGSSKMLYWQNINSKSETILSAIDEAREEMLFINESGSYTKEI